MDISKKTICMFMHAGSGNHGCEALVRSTKKVMGDVNSFVVVNKASEEDKKYKLDEVCSDIYTYCGINKKSIPYIKYAIKYRLTLYGKKLKVVKSIASIFPVLGAQFDKKYKNYIAFSIGGDNYCDSKSEWVVNELCASHDYFIKRNKKTVLWGCSIEEETMKNPRLLADLNKFDLITARDTLSMKNLEKYGVSDNVILTCDSAFYLDTIKLPLPEGFTEGNTVGINVSPLVIACEKTDGIVLISYKKMIRNILDNSDMNVALIPHVIWEGNDDRTVLHKLYDEFKDSGRVVEIPDCNCMELKGYISRCRFFVGARTHATIAAYSSKVPTLVVGYSIKSKGIAVDLFGTYDNYVLPVDEISDENTLSEKFDWLYENEKDIRVRLDAVMPEYCARINDAIKAVNEMF